MGKELWQLIDRFADARILVVGDAMLDCYLKGSTERLCQEAPAPIVALNARTHAPGGAANTAANVAALGARTFFLSVVGNDYEGAALRQSLEEYGVNTAHLFMESCRQTLAKNRIISSGQILLRLDQGSAESIGASCEAELLARLDRLFPQCDAVIVSDYGYGVLTPRVIAALEAWQRAAPRVVVVDAKNLLAYARVATAVKPNYVETVNLLVSSGAPPPGGGSRAEWIAAHGARILELTGARLAAVTLDTEGVLLLEHDCPAYHLPAQPAPQTHSAGAGDTFVSALALALAAGAEAQTAGRIAAMAAAVVVAKEGTACCSPDELRYRILDEGKCVSDAASLALLVEARRRLRQLIVFTNGCFDLLHRGHVEYLNRAREHGDALIVGVNSDAGVRRLKGPGRPVNRLEDRLQVLSALNCVDHLIAFEEDTPSEIIRALKPDVFVKGGDYRRETIAEAPLVEALGGSVEILPCFADLSTTRLIERIQGGGSNGYHNGDSRERAGLARGGSRASLARSEEEIDYEHNGGVASRHENTLHQA